ncbi:probable E3 ubiquitin-protein ligase hip1 [Phtheirospermum japonicum]|uniref:RING-type E3 ubiquitin transferase n=1 Tax=Phtheirospermum japonicum TaxID=374723 RepID=A0A830BHZ0_9LAMI|nr:probable E3 ubiquitin-protein ligase hip1 [Phtheirospermum japonicum]
MGHRHIFNPPQIFENESDQGWNHAEQPYMPIARGAPESRSIIHPMDNNNNNNNMTIQGVHYPPQWTPAPRSSGYSSSIPTAEFPNYQPIPIIAPVPSRGNPFPHQPASGNPHMFQENYPHHPSSSSNIGGQTVNGIDGGFYNQTANSNRGPYKRKSPSIPPMFEMGSTSRYYDVGSSSDIHLPADPWQEKHQNTESYHVHWEHPPSSYGANSLSIGGEGSTMRNVRSRGAVDLEINNPFSNRPSDRSNSVDFWGQSSNAAPSREWNHRNHVAPPPAARGLTFGSDSSFFAHDSNPVNSMNNHHPNSSVEIGACNHNDVTLNRNHVPQNVSSHLNQSQSVRGVRSSYGQRSAPTFRASSSNFRAGPVAAPDEGQHIAESYPLSRHPRGFPNPRLRNVDRNVRSCVSSDRYRYFNEEASFRDRLTPEGLMAVDHNGFYGSRTLFDQHRDMRLDIDNMSYEELLALGERIGSVSTGLSDGLVSKCLTESIYCSSDVSQDEGTCVICLEEYKNMDDVGTLKGCGHDFHVGCIRKWLSMKNLCPICKSAAVDDNNKEK